MAKKSKEKTNNSNPKSIFTTLFGNAPEDAEAASIFSDSNPFRRKPEDDSEKTQKIIEKSKRFADDLNGDGAEKSKKLKKMGEKSKLEVELAELSIEKSKKSKKNGGNLKRIEKDSNLEVGYEDFESEGVELGLDKSKKSKKMDGLDELRKNKDFESGGIVENVEEEGVELGLDNGGIEKKKKKRKRDEVEVEYEKKLYGAGAGGEEGNENENGAVAVGEKRKKRENPEDLMVSKEGFDDEDKLLRTVFVGNLELKIKKKVLIKEFGVFGEIESVRIRSIPILDSKTPRKGAIMKKQINESADSVHAYIVFKTVESAQGALAHNMAMIGGNHIRVDRACPPRKKLKGDSTSLYDNKRTIFVGNLPFDVKDEELYQLFTRMKGLEFSLEAVRVIRDPSSSLGKGIAYVLFKTKEAAKMVIRKRDIKLRDRELRVTHVKLNATPKNIQSVSPGQGGIPSKRGFVESGTPRSSMQNSTASMSYQGLRASKSGVSKKTSTNTVRRVSLNTSNQKAKEPVDRKRKRPAVAARKAKALKSDAAWKNSGTKRKLVGNRTPESSYQNKKARRN